MSGGAKLGLGTVQWGLPYGVSNREGATSPDEVARILASARARGVRTLDTAALYGDAETVLGRQDLAAFDIITKTPRFATGHISSDHADALVETFHGSLQRLGVPRLYGLLLHHATDLAAPGGERLLSAMRMLKSAGLVERIGVSVYDSSQLEAVLDLFQPDLVQLPINVFDHRLLDDGSLARLQSLGVEVHARSAFLQGLLLMRADALPEYFAPLRHLVERWHAACREQGMTPVQAALAFVRDLPGVSVCLVGVQDCAQFEQCANDFNGGQSFDATGLVCNDPAFVNPALWRLQ